MSVIQHLWKGRRIRVAGAVAQVAVDCPDDMAAIYLRYWDLVYRRCLATLGDEQAAEDATQDVFLFALSNFEQVQHDVVRGLLDVARTISYERRRRPAREVSLPNPPHANGNTLDPAEIAERHGELTAVWSGLSPVERRYVADKFAGFSFEEIARRNRRKLGTVSSNLFRAREHARSLRSAPALVGLAGWWHRARSAAHSSATTAAAQPVGALTLSMTLAGLIAGVAPAASAVSAVAAAPSSRPAMAMVPPAVDASGGVVAVSTGIAAAAPGSAVPYAGAAPAPSSHGGAPLLPLGGSASSETPEDTVIDTATPSPNYQQDHTIIALGRGNTCGCNVLLRSTDGGATWEARDGAPTGDQLVLPPAYPADPRILIGGTPSGNSNTNDGDWWAADFDSAFQALPLPTGNLALPAGFDSGDARVIASTPTGVWSYDTVSMVVQPLVVETNSPVAPALATPLGSLDAGVLALTSAQAVTPGTPARAASTSTDLTLWDCAPGHGCTPSADVPVKPGGLLAAAPDYASAPVLVAYGGAFAVASTDGGRSFSTLQPQDGVTDMRLMALGASGGTPSLWVVGLRGSSVVLEFSPSVGGQWHEVDHGLQQITASPGRLVTLGRTSAMYFTQAGGFVCTDDAGGHWSTRCPVA